MVVAKQAKFANGMTESHGGPLWSVAVVARLTQSG